MKTLLNTQKRLNIISLDLVLLVLFSTSTTSFIGKISDNFTFEVIHSFFSYVFGISILSISLYFLALQFYKFKPGRIDTLICDLCLIFNLLFSVIFFNFLISAGSRSLQEDMTIYQTSYPSMFDVPYMSSGLIYCSALVLITASLLGLYSLAIVYFLLANKMLKTNHKKDNEGLKLVIAEKDKRIEDLTQYKEDMSSIANYFKSKKPELIEAPAAAKVKPWWKFW